MFLKIFHLSVVTLNIYTIWYDQMYVDLPFPSKEIGALPFKARFIFLTFWGLILQTIYFSVSLLNDFFGTNAAAPKHPPVVRRVKDILFSLAFAVAIYVSVVFWALYAINKDFILPDEIEALLPPWVNHVMHTTIVPFIYMELLFTKRNYPSRSLGVNLMLLYTFSYTCFVFYLYFRTGVWVYPFMDVLSWGMKFVFIITSAVVSIGIYVLGEKLNMLVSPRSESYANGVNGHAKKH